MNRTTEKQINKSKPAEPARPLRTPLPTLQRIADQSGLSASTISRILSGQAGRYRISKKTEAAVRALAKQVNFVPNQLARGLRLNYPEALALITAHQELENVCVER